MCFSTRRIVLRAGMCRSLGVDAGDHYSMSFAAPSTLLLARREQANHRPAVKIRSTIPEAPPAAPPARPSRFVSVQGLSKEAPKVTVQNIPAPHIAPPSIPRLPDEDPSANGAGPATFPLPPLDRNASLKEQQMVTCPICFTTCHLKLMLQHVNEKHDRQVNRAECRRVLKQRYTAYESLMKRLGVAMPDSVRGGGESVVTGYACRHCTLSDISVYVTVDGLMKHIECDHPSVDVDEEPTPVKTTYNVQHLYGTMVRASAGAVGKPVLPAPIGSAVPGVGTPLSAPSSSSAASAAPASNGAGNGGSLPVLPAVDLPGVISSNVVIDGVRLFESTGPVREGEYLCEICAKIVATELQLLQHLECAHRDFGVPVQDRALPEVATATSATSSPGASEEEEGGGGSTIAGEVMRLMISAYVPSTTERIAIQCDLCTTQQRVFTQETALFSHIVSKHPNVSAAEKVKELMSRSKEAAASGDGDSTGGTASSSNTKKWTCEHCTKVFVSEVAYLNHVVSKHGGAAPHLKTLLPAVTASSMWWCNGCERGYGTAQALWGHLTTKHELPAQNLPCPACNRIFSDVFGLKIHVSEKHKNLDASVYDVDEFFPCSHCGRRFVSNGEREVHCQLHHPKDATW